MSFKPTKDQENAAIEIIDDIRAKKRTLRLLHGDVGSGKTIVSIMAAYYVIKSGYQVAFLAPTELLAKQHYSFISKLFINENIKSDILLASSINKNEIKKKLSENQIQIVIGTHSLLQNDVKFNNLSFVIIDEQHRFGVEQRMKIREKGRRELIHCFLQQLQFQEL